MCIRDSLPGEHGDAMRFAVRINGDFTERLYRTARAGMRVDVIGPFGMYERFIARHDAHAPIVVYAGGVGITPIIPTIMAQMCIRDRVRTACRRACRN